MKFSIFIWIALQLLFTRFVIANETDDTEQYETCSNYYLLLSTASPDMVKDINQKQAGRAFFALQLKVFPNPEKISEDEKDLSAEKLMKMRREIVGPYTHENLKIFREKYDDSCRILLKQAWCDAYKEIDQSACSI